jgi:hypothetical protein
MFSFDSELFLKSAKDLSESLNSLNSLLNSMNDDVSFDPELAGEINGIKSSISSVYDNLEILNQDVKKVEEIINMFEEYRDSVSDDEYASFDENSLSTMVLALYGARQSAASDLFEKYLSDPNSLFDVERQRVNIYYQLFKKYKIDKGDEFMSFLLDLAAKHGCGYSVITNTIVDYYKDKPDEFEKKYGYPLYYVDEKGNKLFNYDCIFVDTFIQLNEDEIKRRLKNKGTNGYSWSVKYSEMESYLKKIFGRKVPIKCSTKRGDISRETYDKMMASGDYSYAVIAVRDFDLVPYGNNPRETRHNDGGHWMTIVGISENGNYIVSSWGFQWELVGGTTSNPNGDTGGMIFYSVGD